MTLEALFWFAIAGTLYSYLLYPVVLLGALMFLPARLSSIRRDAEARLSFVITARNESSRIVAKIENTLGLIGNRAADVLVVSDASDDDTDALVRSMVDSRVVLVRQQERRGKESGQQLGIASTRGDLIVFSDVATRIKPGSVEALFECFGDPQIGAVSSEDRFESGDGRMVGEGLYVKYEMWLRSLESRCAGLVGLSGSFFAARRETCEDWRTDVPSDFMVALQCARRGLRAVTHANVVGTYPDIKNPTDEYSRKRRTVLRGMAGLAAAKEVLNPVRYGWFAFQVWSHKVLRWAVPWFLLLLFFVNLALAPTSSGYAMFFLLQLLGYAAVVAAWLAPPLRRIGLFRIGWYFVTVNIAMADALVRFLRGERIVTWDPSRR